MIVKGSLQVGQNGRNRFTFGIAIRFQNITGIALGRRVRVPMMFSSAVTENAKQAIKTAIAGVAAMYVTNLFHLPQGYWAPISALIVMQSNVGATLSASRTRLAGTAVGAVVGGAFTALLGDNLLDFALAVTLAFFLCFLLRLPDNQRLATVTVAIIMLIGQSASAWVVALHRFAEVSIGILVALVISLVLWPNHARRSLREGLADALLKMGALYETAMNAGHAVSAGSLEALNGQVSDAFRKNAGLLENALQEAFGSMRERESLALLATQVERIRLAVEVVEVPSGNHAADTYPRRFDAHWAQIRSGAAVAFRSLANSIRTGKPESQWPDLMGPISVLDEKAASARTSGETAGYPLDEVLRFYSQLLGSRTLAQELEVTRALVNSRFVAKQWV
jgi:uncharacterized membrane protein YccC